MQFEKEMSREEGISDKGNPRKMGRGSILHCSKNNNKDIGRLQVEKARAPGGIRSKAKVDRSVTEQLLPSSLSQR